MGRLLTRHSCLLVALILAMPAAAKPSPPHRIVAVGDLHGDFAAWRDILRAAQLVDDDGCWTGGDAVLVQTGDVVDRGPNSLKIVQDLMRLQREALRAKGQVIALVGNHEAMNVTGDLRYVSAEDYAAYADSTSERRRQRVYETNKTIIEASYRAHDPEMSDGAIRQAWFEATPPGSIERGIAWAPRGRIGRWIVGNPAVVLVDGNLFVHGGISPAYAHLSIEEINRQVSAALKTSATDPQAIINDPLGPLWYRGLATPNADKDDSSSIEPIRSTPSTTAVELPIKDQLQSLLSAYGANRIVIGHTPILSGIAVLYGGQLVRIDTGISSVYGGKASYLDILDGTPTPHVVERSQPPVKVLAADTPRPLFASDDVISLTLSGPLANMSRQDGAKPVPGVLQVTGSAPETLPVMLSSRGITRRRKEICSFPPLRVEFTEKPGKTSLFKGQKQLKLVTHCQSPEKYQQGVLLEYAAYRLYRALTPESFGIRLAKVDYVGEDGRPMTTRFGFFIEDIDDVARRNGQKRLRGVNRISASQLDPAAAARFAVFQYMISNLDWAMTVGPAGEDCCHNSRLVGAKEATTGLITVPYDFDYSGLVDAPYALPPDKIRVASVRVRRYRGLCQHNEQARAFSADLLTRRAFLLEVVDRTPQLDDGSRRRAASYLGDFFDQISSPSKVAEMLTTCLN